MSISQLNNFLNNLPKNSILNISIDGIGKTDTYLGSLFDGARNLKNVYKLNWTGAADLLYSLFYYCNNLITVSNFDTSNATDMSQMFYSCYNLTNVPNFNTNKVTRLYRTFDSCYNLTNIPNFDTINVKDMNMMFSSCRNLTSIPNFNTSNVTNMNGMFSDCYNLTIIPNFNTINVKDMSCMFDDCHNLIAIPNFDTSNVVYLNGYYFGTFYNCTKLVELPNFNFSKVQYLNGSYGGTFGKCNNLTTIPNFNFSNVINISSAFYGCKNLTAIPNFDFSNVTNAKNAFENCEKIVEFPNFNLKPAKIVSMNYMFYNCSNLTNFPHLDLTSVSNITGIIGGTNIINRLPENINFNFDIISSMEDFFHGCQNLTELPIFNFNTKVTRMSETVCNCTKLASINNFFNTQSITNMYFCFYNCSNLKIICNFNTSNVTDMRYMFGSCTKLIDIPNLDMKNVTQMNSIFEYCYSLVNIPNFNIRNVINMRHAFTSCIKLSQSSINNIISMCANATKVTNKDWINIGLDINQFNTWIRTAEDYPNALNNGWTNIGPAIEGPRHIKVGDNLVNKKLIFSFPDNMYQEMDLSKEYSIANCENDYYFDIRYEAFYDNDFNMGQIAYIYLDASWEITSNNLLSWSNDGTTWSNQWQPHPYQYENNKLTANWPYILIKGNSNLNLIVNAINSSLAVYNYIYITDINSND